MKIRKKYETIKTGDKFGNWIILDETDFKYKSSNPSVKLYKCQCQCINKTIRYVDEANLKNGLSKNCGNCTYKNIEIGDKFGMWTVIDNVPKNRKVLCRCSCKDKTTRMVLKNNLNKGQSTNCGCVSKNNHFAKNQNTEDGIEIHIGDIYNKWTVLKKVKSQSYLCECSCMYHTQKILNRSQLIGDNRKGCKKCRLVKPRIGETFGYLTIGEIAEEETIKHNGKIYVYADCICGSHRTYEMNSIVRGRISSCGCKRYEYDNSVYDLIGKRFGHLVVTDFLGRDNTSVSTALIYKCNCDCGKNVTVKKGNLVYGSTLSCGCMKRSHGEYMIYKFLHKHKFNFVEQFRIEECKDQLPLPFDFALFSNNKLCGLIEFDGEQHFKPYSFNGESQEKTIENFNKICTHDNIKNLYCKRNKIPLCRITYEDLDDGSWIYLLWDFLCKIKLISDCKIA